MPLLLFWGEFLSKHWHSNGLKRTVSHRCSLQPFWNTLYFVADTIRWMQRRDWSVHPRLSLITLKGRSRTWLVARAKNYLFWQSYLLYFEVLKGKASFKLSCHLQAFISLFLLSNLNYGILQILYVQIDS